VIGNHPPGASLSLFLAKTLNAEIRRSNSAMPCCRDMDPAPSKNFGGGLPGVGRIYIKVRDKFQSVPNEKRARPDANIQTKKPASLRGQPAVFED
jgi:hypothetical protein